MTDDYPSYQRSLQELRLMRFALKNRLAKSEVKGNEYVYAVCLIDGINAVLEEFEDYGARDDDKTHEFTQGIEFELRNFVVRVARSYKRHFHHSS